MCGSSCWWNSVFSARTYFFYNSNSAGKLTLDTSSIWQTRRQRPWLRLFGHHLQSCAEQTFTANTGGNSFLADRLLSIQSNDHSSCLKILNIFIIVQTTVWHLAKVWLLPFAVAVCDMCFARPHVTRYFWSLNPFFLGRFEAHKWDNVLKRSQKWFLRVCGWRKQSYRTEIVIFLPLKSLVFHLFSGYVCTDVGSNTIIIRQK